ncbi:MAG: WG repeat-containing protein, partial [Muribaculaceae bacterium]|nr:WG repeat-containing protein [Muribaculaceae bacterium]
KIVIPAKYDFAGTFSEGLAYEKINGKYGFIDKNGNLVIPAKYDDAWYFRNGKARVKLKNIVFYIDKNGKEVK